MKLIPIICLFLLDTYQNGFTQPVSWFAGAGGGITQLHATQFAGKSLNHSGDMGIVMAGVDIPLHENFRPVMRATLAAYKAYFYTARITGYMSDFHQSYSIYLNSITPEVSFLYNIINNKLKLYMGAGVDFNISWSKSNNYKMEDLQTGYIFRDEDSYISLESCWPSFNVKTGLKLGHWELGATGYVRGIIAWNNSEILSGDLFFFWIGYHFTKKNKHY